MSRAHTNRWDGTLRHPGICLTGVAAAVLLLWIGFTTSVKPHEFLLGACATALTVALFRNLVRNEALPFRLRLRDLLLVWQLPKAILTDCWILTVVLVKDLTGRERAGSHYRACGFRISTRDPVRIGRGALAIAYTTASPNMVVIGIDPAQSLMLFHQLRRDAVPAYAQALGAAGQHDTAAAPTRATPPTAGGSR